MQRGEGHLHLRLDPHGAHDPQVRRRVNRVLEQRRLANSWLAAHDQRPTASAPCGLKQLIEHRALVSPTAQHHPASS